MRLHPSEHSEFPLVSVLHPFPTHPTEEPGFGFDFDSSLARFRSDVLASRGSREPFTETPIVSCGQGTRRVGREGRVIYSGHT